MTRSAGPVLCLVTDRRRLAPDAPTTAAELAALTAWCGDAIDAAVDLIQIRERDLDAAALVRVTREVAALAAGTATRVVVNDRLDVARAADAAGVHLPAAGLPVAAVRAGAPEGFLVGRSVHGAGEAAEAAGADYVIFGTMFASVSKPGGRTQTMDQLRCAAIVSAAPVLVIGGVTPARAGALAATGASGIAAIGAFLPPGRSPDGLGPRAAATAFRAAWRTADSSTVAGSTHE